MAKGGRDDAIGDASRGSCCIKECIDRCGATGLVVTEVVDTASKGQFWCGVVIGGGTVEDDVARYPIFLSGKFEACRGDGFQQVKWDVVTTVFRVFMT